jgi:hypothetical protein
VDCDEIDWILLADAVCGSSRADQPFEDGVIRPSERDDSACAIDLNLVCSDDYAVTLNSKGRLIPE